MSAVVVDTTNYVCYGELATFNLLQSLLLQYIADIVDANTLVTEDGVECTLTDTDFQELHTNILQIWASQAIALHINRAIYPLPDTLGLIVDV